MGPCQQRFVGMSRCPQGEPRQLCYYWFLFDGEGVYQKSLGSLSGEVTELRSADRKATRGRGRHRCDLMVSPQTPLLEWPAKGAHGQAAVPSPR